MSQPTTHYGLAGRIAHFFIDSQLTPLVIAASILLGVFAVVLLPREEEPQIIVPMIDVMVSMPGSTAKEVEERVTNPMERLLWEIPGVEYVYSITQPGGAIAIVRYKVGTDETEAIVRTYNKMHSNFDLIPPGASQPLIKPRSIDDVPILALTFHGSGYDSAQLRRVAAEIDNEVKQLPDVSETTLIGGQRREVLVTLDSSRMAGYQVGAAQVMQALQGANRELPGGSFSRDNREFLVQTGGFLADGDAVGSVVIGASDGRPVYLRDVASVTDGPEEPVQYVMFGSGAEEAGDHNGIDVANGSSEMEPAVTLAIAKRKGTNAIVLANKILDKVEALRGEVIPQSVEMTVTRNYGETAAEKSNELLKHLLIATLSVTLLVALALGRRESGVVLVAIPTTLALTLLVFLLYGYTLNRVTLFALIFSIGILVDDAIVVVENIVRHFRLPENHGRPLSQVAVEAVDEVGNPTILATFAVIAAIVPMAFVRGLMGPYMKPIPVGASAAMLFSMVIAFAISPWAALRLLRRQAREGDHGVHESEGWTTRLYRRAMTPLLLNPRRRTTFLIGVVALLLLVVAMFPLKLVRVKMLPFDNKSEFQVIVDMPEGSTLEQTHLALADMARYLRTEPEVTNVQTYAGTAGPFNFNGLVRRYFLRNGPNVGDIQVNLAERHDRKAQSHDVAKRVRPRIEEIAAVHGARAKVAEVPPGPPVLQTLVAEIYGPSSEGRLTTASRVMEVFEKTPGVVDIDWYVEDAQPKYNIVIDREKAALNGIDAAQATEVVNMALSGHSSQLAHIPTEREDVPINLRLSRAGRSGIDELLSLRIQGSTGNLVPLSAISNVSETTAEPFIYHKNLQPVVYVTADVAGAEESPVYAILKLNRALDDIKAADGTELERFTTRQPFTTVDYSMKWDGEWHITYEVFRDLGLAFAAVMVLIYVLVVGWFKNFITPLVIMAAIPFSLVGILPGHAIMGAFFTATSMIGFIAGAGIVVRNSIILVDFIELRRKQGMPLAEAVVDAGAVRFRPMLLTAAAVIVGASVILFDPIFQGLAISLMAGEVASLLLSRMTVPVLYYMAKRHEEKPVVVS